MLQGAQLTAKPVKPFLCKKTVQHLGYMITKNGITTTEENIEKIKNDPIAKNVKEVRGYLITFSRKMIAQLSNYSVRLSDLTKRPNGTSFSRHKK